MKILANNRENANHSSPLLPEDASFSIASTAILLARHNARATRDVTNITIVAAHRLPGLTAGILGEHLGRETAMR